MKKIIISIGILLPILLNISIVMAICVDNDGDGFGNPASPDCAYPELDCNDNNYLVRPPADGMVVNQSTTFCSGTYDLPNGVTLWFGEDNIVLDCNGAVLNGLGGGVGIQMSGMRSNKVIKNCVVENYSIGIQLENFSNSNTILNNNISYNNVGVWIYDSYDNIFSYNLICSNNIDIKQGDVSDNLGEHNTCDITQNWEDNGTTGCTYSCPVTCIDNDGDGFNQSQVGCGVPDCEDNNASIYPGAAEICDNGVDDDCDGFIDFDDNDCCTTPTNGMSITENTTFCKGTYNLPNGISIDADYVALDCNNATLIGSFGANGITMSYIDGAEITMCNIYNYDEGIYLEYSFDNFIWDNTLSNNYYDGIYGYTSGYNLIMYNIITNNSFSNMFLEESTNNIIYYNFIAYSDYAGLYFSDVSNSFIVYNLIADNEGDGIYSEISHDNTFLDNILGGNDGGIFMDGSYSSVINRTRLLNNSYGIFLYGSEDIILTNNSIYYSDDGIYLQYASRNNITENRIFKNDYTGIFIDESWGNLVDDNLVFENNVSGIYSLTSRYNIISNNNISDNNKGIEVDLSTNNTFFNNAISNNINGISIIFESENNSFFNNNITKNLNAGIFIEESPVNYIWHNNIYDNTFPQVISNKSIELSYNNEGNYWGRNSCPYFIAGVDSNAIDVVDSYPYDQAYYGNWPTPSICTDNDNDSYYSDVDCDDNNASIYPGAIEICNDLVDNDCDGLIDSNDSNCPRCTTPTDGMSITENTTFCTGTYDLPDGITLGASSIVLDCNGAVLNGSGFNRGILDWTANNVIIRNCTVKNYDYGIYFYNTSGSNTIIYNNILNNNNGIYFPYSSNNNVYNNIMCNNINYDINNGGSNNVGDDNTCDNAQNWNDNGTTGCTYSCPVTCIDNDGDGFNQSQVGCGVADCDDSNINIYPGAPELCNFLDDDCDGSFDDDGVDETWYGQATSCGVGECAATGQLECINATQADTCIPGQPSAEICDGLDNNCDGLIDEGFDADSDGIVDCFDNCPAVNNSNQLDTDVDGLGDVCDTCPLDPYNDIDGDNICGDIDNCPTVPNLDQTDTDTDSVGDLCDNCLNTYNPDQQDSDGDTTGNACDIDDDNDGLNDTQDNIIGNSTYIQNNFDNITVNVNGTNDPLTANGISNVTIKENNNSVVEFEFNFSADILDLSNITILKQTSNDSGSIIVSGINLPENKTKTIYIDNLNPVINTICIKDEEIASITEITINCNGTSELLLTCDSVEIEGYKCTDLGTRYEVTGLIHSGIVEKALSYNIIPIEGWNLVSLPLEPFNKTVKSLFSDSSSKIFTYYDGKWYKLNDSSQINLSHGYWVKTANNISIAGVRIENLNYNLQQGWNLISYPALESNNVNALFENVSSEINNILVYRNDNWLTYSFNKIINSLNVINPGEGIWVDVKQNTAWTFDGKYKK